jgi:photosystem II stability/assembly factor-like uncharacterized protein
MKKLFSKQNLSTLFVYLSILIFIIAFNFSDTPTPTGWYQQFMPNLNNMALGCIHFTDSLNGYAGTNGTTDSNYILKTTNGGDNWAIKFKDLKFFNEFMFLNNNTGFVCGSVLYKTTNAGDNWFLVSTPFGKQVLDMHVLNSDTIWFADPNSLDGGLFRTTNGGTTWQQQYYNFGYNPSRIYMYNARIGFMDGGGLQKTTNSGVNWFSISGEGSYSDMHFIDSLTGWKCTGDTNIKKTTNGGINWINQSLPKEGGFFSLSRLLRFAVVNKDTLWGVGARASTSLGFRGLIYKTTNGGNLWGYQLPDTNTINIGKYSYVEFFNKYIGWAYSNNGVHTTTGGDTTFYTNIKLISTEIPKQFTLHQNYPNPFNPVTKIAYELKVKKLVEVKVFDISGKEIAILVNQQQSPGTYEVQFSGTDYSTGVYFYSLIVDGSIVDTKKMLLVK